MIDGIDKLLRRIARAKRRGDDLSAIKASLKPEGWVWVVEQIDEVWDLYWMSDIPTTEICDAYNISAKGQVSFVAGPCFIDGYDCRVCGASIDFRSRSELKAEFGRCGGKRVRCTDCERVEEAAREERYRQKVTAREKRAEALRTMPYGEYLQTPEWRERRAHALKRARFRCSICGKNGPLQVHHRTYARRGAELNADLTVLCDGCHTLFHASSKLAANGRADGGGS